MIIYGFGVASGVLLCAAGQYFLPSVTAKVYGWVGSLILAAASAMHFGGTTP